MVYGYKCFFTIQCCHFQCSLIRLPWRWRQQVLLKYWYLQYTYVNLTDFAIIQNFKYFRLTYVHSVTSLFSTQQAMCVVQYRHWLSGKMVLSQKPFCNFRFKYVGLWLSTHHTHINRCIYLYHVCVHMCVCVCVLLIK
jgi:hypothetical protein